MQEEKPNKQGHQFAVFLTGQNSLYAINVAKIKAFIIQEDITINNTPSQNDVIVGIATIRSEPIMLVHLDSWLGLRKQDTKEYKLLIYCEFSRKKIAILVKDMVSIIEKTTSELSHLVDGDSKVTHTMYTSYKNKEELCTVFNAEQLLQDIGLESNISNTIKEYKNQNLHSNKMILIAEDSQVARSVISEFLDTINANYKVFNDGQLLLNYLKESSTETIGLIITDIEMPNIDGFEVVEFVKNNTKLQHIPVIVNSSMATNSVTLKMKSLGASDFVEKTNIQRLHTTINKYLLK